MAAVAEAGTVLAQYAELDFRVAGNSELFCHCCIFCNNFEGVLPSIGCCNFCICTAGNGSHSLVLSATTATSLPRSESQFTAQHRHRTAADLHSFDVLARTNDFHKRLTGTLHPMSLLRHKFGAFDQVVVP